MKSQQEQLDQIEALLLEMRQSGREAGSSLAVEERAPSRSFWKMWKSVLTLWKWRSLMLIVIMVLVIAGLTFGIFAWFSGSNAKEDKGAFVEHIQEMNSLATAQAYVKAVIEKKDNKLFGKDINVDLPGTKRELLLIVPGTVVAGVDLQRVSENDIKVNEEKKTISLTLPKATFIQDAAIQPDQIKAFSVEGLFRSDVNWKEGYALADEAKALVEKEAKDQGLLDVAQKNAEKSLKEFFKTIGYKIDLTFK
jgi:hypothetical protein